MPQPIYPLYKALQCPFFHRGTPDQPVCPFLTSWYGCKAAAPGPGWSSSSRAHVLLFSVQAGALSLSYELRQRMGTSSSLSSVPASGKSPGLRAAL